MNVGLPGMCASVAACILAPAVPHARNPGRHETVAKKLKPRIYKGLTKTLRVELQGVAHFNKCMTLSAHCGPARFHRKVMLQASPKLSKLQIAPAPMQYFEDVIHGAGQGSCCA